MKEFNRFKFVLCRPSEGGNVGAACRAMKAMGLSRLAIVSPERELDMDALKAMAVHALDLWEAAEFHDSLEDALRGASLAVGATRRRGKWRKSFSLPVQEFARDAWARAGEIAIVFGNERTGLTHQELSHCALAVSIPSSDDFPSLNLAQAVQVFAWELFRARPELKASAPTPAGFEACASVAALLSGTLEGMSFFRHREREATETFLRDVALRAALTEGELRRWKALLMKCIGRGLQSGGGEDRLES